MNVFLSLLPLISLGLSAPCDNVIVCYYPTYRSTALPPYKIDPNVCTHIVVAFSKVESNQMVPEEAHHDQIYSGVLNLKKQNPDLKVLISVGGENSAQQFSGMVQSDANMKTFSKSIKTFLDKYGFDGVDIDWEFPDAYQKDNFGTLLKYVREEIGVNRVFGIAVTANYADAQYNYPHNAMQTYLDFVFEMSYNFHGLWEQQTGINAPLIGPAGDPYTSDYIMNVWEKLGISKDKLVLGIPAYGTYWTLTTARNDVGAPGTPGTWVTFNEICVSNSSYTWRYDSKYDGTYAYLGNKWITMETESMVAKKADYVLTKRYRGVLFWEIGQDDFSGNCNAGTFPLVMASKKVLCPGTGGSTVTTKSTTVTEVTGSSTATTTTGSSTATATASASTASTSSITGSASSTTPATAAPGTCSQLGSYADPTDCHYYFVCGNIGYPPTRMTCGPTLVFNPESKVCDWAYNVPSCSS